MKDYSCAKLFEKTEFGDKIFLAAK